MDLQSIHGVVPAFVYATLGAVVFAVAFFAIVKLTPFSVRKEIEEDQNVALAVVLGAVFLGLAHIIAAAIQG